MQRITLFTIAFFLAGVISAAAVPPANPGDRYKAMTKRCKQIADSRRMTPYDNVTTQMLYDASGGKCDYRDEDRKKWRG